MRIVAIGALLLLVGLVALRELQSRLFDLLMTRKTQFAADGIQKLIVPSRMRSVTGKATVVAIDRSVHILHADTRVFVARKAELAARIHEQRRRFGGMRVMAVQARPVFERLVLHVTGHEKIFRCVALEAEAPDLRRSFESIVGASGIVTGLAFTSEHWIMDARFQQGGQRRRMWVVADRARLLFHRVIGMRRSEGAVAVMARNA
jgi:hypothetical protein